MPLYKKKPIEVEAVQWNKPGDMPGWAKSRFYEEGKNYFYVGGPNDGTFGDYILRTASGSIMVCKPDVFEATYEPV